MKTVDSRSNWRHIAQLLETATGKITGEDTYSITDDFSQMEEANFNPYTYGEEA